MMRTAGKIAALVFSLSVWPAAAYGQGQCTMQNIAASYAFTFTGASTIVAGTAADTLHWNALYAPIAGVGVFTITPDGKAEGQYWLVAGAWNLGLTPIPWQATVTLNPDCTGTLDSYFQGALMREQFVVVGNGSEIRSVAVQTPVPTGNWLGVAHRLGGSCRQEKIVGDFLFQCKNLFEFPIDPPNIFGGAIHIRMTLAPSGDYTGSVYGKVATDNSSFPAFGRITIHDDCTAEGTLATPVMPTVSHARGVFFDEGRQGYWLPLVNSLPDGSVRPQPYGYCQITRIVR